MAELIEIVFIIFLAIFSFGITVIALVLVLKFLDHRRKSINYVEKNYQGLIDFTRQMCPDNIFGYNLEKAVTKTSEGRILGKIVGYSKLAIKLKNNKGKIIEIIKRHFITYRPSELDFNLLNPRTWKPQFRIAIISDEELPFGLNGNVRWEASSIDWYKFYIYSVSDPQINKEVLAIKIADDVSLDFGMKAWEQVGEIVSKAAETDANLIKSIKTASEFRPRNRN